MEKLCGLGLSLQRGDEVFRTGRVSQGDEVYEIIARLHGAGVSSQLSESRKLSLLQLGRQLEEQLCVRCGRHWQEYLWSLSDDHAGGGFVCALLDISLFTSAPAYLAKENGSHGVQPMAERVLNLFSIGKRQKKTEL